MRLLRQRGTMGTMAKPATTTKALRHLRLVEPFQFPSSDPEWDMPESVRHGRLCELLYQILIHTLGPEHSVGEDNFVYYDKAHPKRCLAPDGFVKLGFPNDVFDTWQTWERGVPELCIEILSPSDTEEKLTFRTKLSRYHALGTKEFISFNIDAPVGSRLRAWDRVRGKLVPRRVANETTPCRTLGLHWVIARGGGLIPVALRLAKDPEGRELLLTAEEAERAEKEVERRAKEVERAARQVEHAARVKAETEVTRLMKLLAKRKR